MCEIRATGKVIVFATDAGENTTWLVTERYTTLDGDITVIRGGTVLTSMGDGRDGFSRKLRQVSTPGRPW